MGRVSRYKKVKQCYNNSNSAFGAWGFQDVVQPRKRSRTAQRLKPRDHSNNLRNTAPENEEDEFDLRTLHVRKKRVVENPLQAASTKEAETRLGNKNLPTATTAVVVATSKQQQKPTTVTEETPEDAKLFRQISKQMKQDELNDFKKSMERNKGESKRAYRRRLKLETRNIIQQAQAPKHQNAEKKEKKKEFLKQKKKRKREGAAAATAIAAQPQQRQQQPAEDDDVDDAPRPEPVVFGDCVERPPVFTQLPRGATRNRHGPSSSIEALRDQVQKQYAALREKRRQQHGL